MRLLHFLAVPAITILVGLLPSGAKVQPADRESFVIEPPGHVAAGQGAVDFTLRAPNMLFPIQQSFRATLNSQVYSPGGGQVGGDQCDVTNYDEHWQDTLCETRGAKQVVPLGCPLTTVHQGIDLRGGTANSCNLIRSGEERVIPIVAVEDGTIASIGAYTVTLRTSDGRKYRYMHMDMAELEVTALETVSQGDVIGYMSNDFGGTPTTFHLHIEHWVNIPGRGIIPVPLYCDLAEAYSRLHGVSYDVVGGGQRCDGTAAPTRVVDEPALSMDHLVSYWDHNGSEMGLLADGDRRTIVYLQPRPALAGIVEPGQVLFNGRKEGNFYIGLARVFTRECPPATFAVTGPVLAGGLQVELSGEAPQRNPACDIVGENTQVLAFDFIRQIGAPAVAVTCGPDDAARLSLTEKTRNWGAITMFLPVENWLPYVLEWPGLRVDAAGLPVDLGRDRLGGTLPAFETDEAGVGIWWYWLLVRKGFGDGGMPVAQPTFRQISVGIAGSNASDAALAAYTNAYTGLSERYFGRAIGLDDPIDITDADIRWALAQTMFHHEAGRTPLINRETFDRGIAFGTDWMQGSFEGVNAYLPDCAKPIGPAADAPAAREPGPAPDAGDGSLLTLPAQIQALEERLAAVEAEQEIALRANVQLNELVSDLRSRLSAIAEMAQP